MIVRVCERAAQAQTVSRVIVATDEARIFNAVRVAGFEAQMTRADHASGSDRLAEVAARLSEAEIIVNVQGDEPLIAPETIDCAVRALVEDDAAQVATTCERVTRAEDVLSADVVKVICDAEGRALYFSRAPAPLPRDAVRRHGSLEQALKNEPQLVGLFRKHTGLYVYRRDFLLRFAQTAPTIHERIEGLEQLRALENGAKIRVIETTHESIGVDTPEDLERVRQMVAVSNQQSAVS